MADLKTWVAGARPRTLPAAVVPVLVGTACAAGVRHMDAVTKSYVLVPLNASVPVVAADDGATGLSFWRMLAALIVALAIQVGTNYANDYSDGKRGTDDPGRRTGPPRLVGWGLAEPGQVKLAAVASFGVAALAGLALAAAVSWWLIVVGAVCFAAGWLYTGGPRPYGYVGLGEAFVFVFFGLVATIGSAYVQTGVLTSGSSPVRGGLSLWVERYPWLTLAAAAAVGCLATALLVVNNLRDIPSDSVAGKRTLAVRIGDRRTRDLYLALIVVAFVLVPVIAAYGRRPWGLLALVAAAFAYPPIAAVGRGALGPDLVPVLGQTGRLQLAFGALLAFGLYVSA